MNLRQFYAALRLTKKEFDWKIINGDKIRANGFECLCPLEAVDTHEYHTKNPFALSSAIRLGIDDKTRKMIMTAADNKGVNKRVRAAMLRALNLTEED